MIIPLYLELVRSNLKYCVQFWAFHCKKDTELLEHCSEKGLEHRTHDKPLREQVV